MSTESKTELFRDPAKPCYATHITRSPMKGFSYVRFDGSFFASLDDRPVDPALTTAARAFVANP